MYWWQMFDIESVEESKTQRDREWVETDIIIIYMHNIVIVRVLWTLSEVKLWYAKSTTKKIGYMSIKHFFLYHQLLPWKQWFVLFILIGELNNIIVLCHASISYEKSLLPSLSLTIISHRYIQ